MVTIERYHVTKEKSSDTTTAYLCTYPLLIKIITMKKKQLVALIILASLSIPGCADNSIKDGRTNTGENKENIIKWYPVPQPADRPSDAIVILPAARDYNSYSGVPLKVLFNNWVRDPFILNAPDEYYYMVGTPELTTLPAPLKSSPESNGWWYNDVVFHSGVQRT